MPQYATFSLEGGNVLLVTPQHLSLILMNCLLSNDIQPEPEVTDIYKLTMCEKEGDEKKKI